jgi:Protein of unknown function (DUF1116)
MIGNKEIDEANQIVVKRILNSNPVLVDIKPAIDAIPGMKKNLLLCAGPPINWSQMCEPVKAAILGAIVYENFADTLAEAEQIVLREEITFSSTHNHAAVAPMAGVISASMPVFVVKNETYGNFSFSNMNEGVGQVKTLRFGANNEEVITRLKWMREKLGPILKTVVSELHGINLKEIIAAAIRRGDECHNRNKCATDIFFQKTTMALLKGSFEKKEILPVLEFMLANPHFFLNMSMAASKATMNSAHGIDYSTVVTAMSTNGVQFGIRISGLGDEWFTAPAPHQDQGKLFKGFVSQDANPVFGDSYISEPAGIGAFAMAASPAIAEFVGGTPEYGIEITKQMGKITLAKHSTFRIPYLNYEGTPTGIDFRKVLQTNILPVVNTGLAHKKAGIGQIGAGIARAPRLCFEKAKAAFDKKYE